MASRLVMTAPHAHNDIEVNYSTSELVYSSAGKTTTLPPGTPCAFWGAKPHQLIQIDEGHLMAFVTIPLARFMSWGLPESVADWLLRGTVLLGSPESTPGELAPDFDRWMRELVRTKRMERRAAELEVEALLWRMAGGSWVETMPAHARSSIELERASRMATFIAEHAHEDIRVADVARLGAPAPEPSVEHLSGRLRIEHEHVSGSVSRRRGPTPPPDHRPQLGRCRSALRLPVSQRLSTRRSRRSAAPTPTQWRRAQYS